MYMYIMCAIGRHFEIVIQSASNISMIGNIDFVVSKWHRNIKNRWLSLFIKRPGFSLIPVVVHD